METTAEKVYAINLGWFEKKKISFPETAGKRLCPSCAKKLSAAKKESAGELIKVIAECCAKEKDYIHPQQSVVESIFRFFLSTDNKPLTADQIVRKVSEKRMGNPLSISTETLQKLLDDGRYLGVGAVSAD